MKVAIYQQANQPVSVVSFAPGVDPVKEAKRVIPAGLPFWLVDRSYIEEIYPDESLRNEWVLQSDILAIKPSGKGALK